jgi:hypothetical protein
VIGMALRVSLAALLLGLSGCAGLAGGAGAAAVWLYDAYSAAKQVFDVTEATVCGAYGAYDAYQQATGFKTPAELQGDQDKVADYCSSDPTVGSTAIDVLKEMTVAVQRLHAASAPART